MNNLIETICEDNKVRYTRVGDLYYSLQRKDEDWVISNKANIELEPFENLYTTIL